MKLELYQTASGVSNFKYPQYQISKRFCIVLNTINIYIWVFAFMLFVCYEKIEKKSAKHIYHRRCNLVKFSY